MLCLAAAAAGRCCRTRSSRCQSLSLGRWSRGGTSSSTRSSSTSSSGSRGNAWDREGRGRGRSLYSLDNCGLRCCWLVRRHNYILPLLHVWATWIHLRGSGIYNYVAYMTAGSCDAVNVCGTSRRKQAVYQTHQQRAGGDRVLRGGWMLRFCWCKPWAGLRGPYPQERVSTTLPSTVIGRWPKDGRRKRRHGAADETGKDWRCVFWPEGKTRVCRSTWTGSAPGIGRLARYRVDTRHSCFRNGRRRRGQALWPDELESVAASRPAPPRQFKADRSSRHPRRRLVLESCCKIANRSMFLHGTCNFFTRFAALAFSD